MGDGGIDIHRLLRNPVTLFLVEVLEGPHVVQAISQFDEHHAHIVNHGEQHLADILRLLFFPRHIADMRNLGQAFDQVGDFFAKVITDRIGVGQGVFDDVVEQTSGN
jgi:hypothetical protein